MALMSLYASHISRQEKLVRSAPFPIRMVQTDNGAEFINALPVTRSKQDFEEALIEMGIEYHRIQIATPRHNGKVERQHRTDGLRCCKRMRIYCLEDGRKRLAAYQRRSNDHIMTCLGMRSPMRWLTCIGGSCSRQGHYALLVTVKVG